MPKIIRCIERKIPLSLQPDVVDLWDFNFNFEIC